MAAVPEYIPAPYLVAEASPLTEEQLTRCYRDFVHSLEYVSAAPSLVFERVVANILNALKVSSAAASPDRCTTRAIIDTSPPVYQQQPNSPTRPIASGSPPSPVPAPYEPPQPPTATIATSHTAARRTPAIGNFHTTEVLPRNTYTGASKLVAFSPPYTSAPTIVTGLRWLSIPADGTPRATTHARNITPATFEIYAVNDCPATRFGACASWLELAPEDADFQAGTFSTTEDHPSVENRRATVRRVVFARAYERPPQVVSWLSGFLFEQGGSLGVLTYVEGVSATGFDLWVVTEPPGTSRFSAAVSWAACSEDRPHTKMGSFSTVNPFQRTDTGFIPFEHSGFREESMRVFLAVNKVVATGGKDVNLRVSSTKMDEKGLSWYVCTWGSADVTSVGASFIVLG